jgi:hypothetical protein
MRSPLRIAVVTLLVAGSALAACKRGAPEPVAPPAQSGASLPPRFDGVYGAKVPSAQPQGDPNAIGVDLLRFTADGHVRSLSIPSAAALESAVRALVAGTDRAASGTYAIKDGVLRFSLTSKLGTVEYAGAVKDDGLAVRWHSAINDATAEESFSFIRTEGGKGGDDGQEPEPSEDGGAPPPAAPAAPAGPPELALIPTGQGWSCFRAPSVNTSRCERSSAACEAAFKEATTARPTLKLTRCAKKPVAFCHTVRKGSRGSGFCYSAEDECKAGAAGFDGPDLAISVCGRF